LCFGAAVAGTSAGRCGFPPEVQVFGVFSGLALIGLTTSADANIGKGYTLLSIAGVILGRGEFIGGRVSPVGAVIGALTLTLAGSLLNFMRISPDWQVGAQGGILIIVLAARSLINQAKFNGPAEILAKPWIWSYLGAFLVWLAAIVFTHGYGAGGMISAALALAVFSVIAGVAQMFVITLGPGNIDLSLPANIGLASAVAMKMMNGSDSLIVIGFLAAGLITRDWGRISPGVDRGRCHRRRPRPRGKANVPGLWGGALFLVLLLTMLNTFGVSAGVRFVVTGLVIIGVIVAAGGQKAGR